MNKIGDVAQLIERLSIHEKSYEIQLLASPIITFLLTYLPRSNKFKIIGRGNLNKIRDVA